MTETHTRWKFWPARGAYGATGGHVRCLGFCYGWTAQWDQEAKWSPTWSFHIGGLFYIVYEPWRGTRWAIGWPVLQFRRAQFRIGERERAREERKAKRWYAKFCAEQATRK